MLKQNDANILRYFKITINNNKSYRSTLDLSLQNNTIKI